jgi:DinB superfamily
VSDLSVTLQRMEENRRQTGRFISYLKLLARHEAKERGTRAEEEEARLLAANPGPGGHRSPGPIGWHLLHVSVFEEGCFGESPRPEFWERFDHGRPTFVPAATLAEIEADLARTRAGLLRLSERLDDRALDRVPRALAEGDTTYRDLFDLAVWHEPHHLVQCNDNLRMQFIAGPGE